MTFGKLHETITNLMNDRLKLKLANQNRTLNNSACIEIYTVIFDTVTEIFQSTNVQVSNELINYIAQQYYDSVLINGKQSLDPNIFTQRAKLDSINTEELKFLAVYYRKSPYFEDVFKALKKRC